MSHLLVIISIVSFRYIDLTEIVVESWSWDGHKQAPQFCTPSSEKKHLEHPMMCVNAESRCIFVFVISEKLNILNQPDMLFIF